MHDVDLDKELDEWMEKESARLGVDKDLQAMEMEVWRRWRENPNPEDFGWLYNSHQGLIGAATGSKVRSAELPRSAMRSRILRNYIQALETYDPTKAALNTHVQNRVKYRLGRYTQRYSQLGRIPEERARLIDPLRNREAVLREQLGREPSDLELSDDIAANVTEMRTSVTPKMVSTLRRELKRQDLRAEAAGGEAFIPGENRMMQYITFLHGSLNPEQQLVLEHTYEGFGKPVIVDPIQLSEKIGLSPQKIRAIKKQIARKVKT